VNPNGADTHYSFEYGTTPSYGSTTPSVDAGSGTNPVAASANITGLAPSTTNHFQLVATSSSGTTNGGDLTFTTTPPATTVASQQFGIPNQTDVFSVAGNGAVQVWWVDGAGSWNGPMPISAPGLTPAGAHLAVSNQYGTGNQTDVFVVGNDGATQVLWVDGYGSWSGPQPISPANSAPPGAGLAASPRYGVANQTDVFVVGNDGPPGCHGSTDTETGTGRRRSDRHRRPPAGDTWLRLDLGLRGSGSRGF
jgi:hypothetical protein